MAQPIPASLADIRLNLQARLMAVTGFPAERVVNDASTESEDEDTNFEAEQVLFVRIQSATSSPSFEGAGRWWSPQRQRVTVVLWTRTALDEPPGFGIGLTDPNLGHDAFRAMIYDALQGYIPTDASDNWLVQEPLDYIDSEGPTRRKWANRDWARSSTYFAMIYAPKLDTSYL